VETGPVAGEGPVAGGVGPVGPVLLGGLLGSSSEVLDFFNLPSAPRTTITHTDSNKRLARNFIFIYYKSFNNLLLKLFTS
jgi:hypothetical protein